MMNRKRTIAVVVACLLSLSVLGCTKSAEAPPPVNSAGGETKLNVYYFYRTVRCPSCEKIEMLAQKAVEEGFAGELAAGKMQWRAINIDEPENRHFDNDYQLEAQSVVVSEVRNGKETRWKNLKKVWDLLDNDQDFVTYVQTEVRAFKAQ